MSKIAELKELRTLITEYKANKEELELTEHEHQCCQEDGRGQLNIIHKQDAELSRLAPLAKMVEQMEVLARDSEKLLDYRWKPDIWCGIDVWDKNELFYRVDFLGWTRGGGLGSFEFTGIFGESRTGFADAFTQALTALLSSLPDPARSELAQKLGVE